MIWKGAKGQMGIFDLENTSPLILLLKQGSMLNITKTKTGIKRGTS